MRKLLVICGPTATGKTGLALSLAKKFNGELISADSRQVYKSMDIGTGKDLPKNVKYQMSNIKCFGKKIFYYTINGVRQWAYDLVEPTEEFSVAQYVKIARKIIKDIWRRDKLPILVGGTGLYIKGVVDGISTAKVPINKSLRKSLEGKKVSDLFELLAQTDPVKAASMNSSDRRNPRRLVRAIEIASAKVKSQKSKVKSKQFDALFIGLSAPKAYLDKRIEDRVDKRVKQGIEREIKSLFKRGVTWKNQSMQALGYKQWKDYFRKFDGDSGWEKRGTETLNDSESTPKNSYLLPRATPSRRRSESTGQAERKKVIESWILAEKQYAKRQMTWFKKNKAIVWFDISKYSWNKRVEKKVKEWHNSKR